MGCGLGFGKPRIHGIYRAGLVAIHSILFIASSCSQFLEVSPWPLLLAAEVIHGESVLVQRVEESSGNLFHLLHGLAFHFFQLSQIPFEKAFFLKFLSQLFLVGLVEVF